MERCHISVIVRRDFEQENDRIKFFKLTSATLQLFEDILSKPSLEIINDLVLKQLSMKSVDISQNNFETIDIDWSMLEKPNISANILSKFNSINVLDQMNTVANEICHLSNIQNQTFHIESLDHLIKILYLFTSLVPDELKFDIQQEKAEYEAYLKEAVKGFHIFIITSFIKWNLDDNNQCNDDDDQCNFVKILFDNLNSLIEIPYEMKIQLFSILAKISLVPNECINNCFLNPMKTNDESLFNILHKLIENLQISVKGIDNLYEKLWKTKLKLLGERIPNEANDNDDDEKEKKILQSLIVLNEFCKELSSIIYVKNYTLKLCNEKK